MWVIAVENAPDQLRGTLSRWGVEVRAGLYVGSSSGKIRDAIWELVRSYFRREMNAVMVFDSTGPQGFEARTLGENSRELVDMDGLWLARYHPRIGDGTEPAPETLSEESLSFDPSEFDPDFLEP